MKISAAVVSLAFALLLGACNKQAPASNAAKPPPAPEVSAPVSEPKAAPAPERTQVAEEAPVQAPAPVEPPPPAKVYAPAGTLFALERISVTTEDGVFTVPAGTRLHVVRKQGDGYLVSDKKHEFAVEEHQVTNEMGAATAAMQGQQYEQAATAASARVQAAAVSEYNQAQKIQGAAEAGETDRQRRIGELEAARMTLIARIAELRSKVEVSDGMWYRAYYHSYSRIGTSTVDPNVRAAWKRDLTVAEQQKLDVDQELSRLRYERRR